MSRSSTIVIVLASLLGLSALILGAVGAHALGNPEAWQSAVRMHTTHALFLIGLVAIQDKLHRLAFAFAAVLVVIGVLFFSGSIYFNTLCEPENPIRLAPYGGSMLMLAWLSVSVGAVLKPLSRRI
jgi:uncharacterized membrane protein YgdD (TMEM256/DUF423 family)